MVGGEVDDNLMGTELRLGLPGTDETQKPTPVAQRGTKRALDNANDESLKTSKISNGHESDHMADIPHETAPAAKSRVVGWPPIQTFRKNSFQARKMEAEETLAGIYVKVSMEGAPYLRKIDLKFYEGYKELREQLENMFRCFSIGSEYAIAYEDKDGDLMLVGDVPWEMFTSSCKRLRIMKGCEGRGVCSNT